MLPPKPSWPPATPSAAGGAAYAACAPPSHGRFAAALPNSIFPGTRAAWLQRCGFCIPYLGTSDGSDRKHGIIVYKALRPLHMLTSNCQASLLQLERNMSDPRRFVRREKSIVVSPIVNLIAINTTMVLLLQPAFNLAMMVILTS